MWLKDFDYTLNKAKALKEAGFYDVAALYIHLAVEKALKAAIAAFNCQEPPKSHALESLYSKVANNLDLSENRDTISQKTNRCCFWNTVS